MMTDDLRLWPGGPYFLQSEHMKLTTDALLLADFAGIEGCRVGADLGCASGILMLLLLWRSPDLVLYGFERQEDAAALAEENLRINSLAGRGKILRGDFRTRCRELKPESLDFVISNPPYYTTDSGKTAPDTDRAAARAETDCSLAELCSSAARLLKNGGRFCLCYKPERLTELLLQLRNAQLEPKRMRIAHHDCMHRGNLLLLECRKGGRPGLSMEKPMLLSEPDGRESAEYRRICHRKEGLS